MNNRDTSTFATKVGLAEMLKGGVIMDVVDRRAGADRRGGGRRRGDGARARAGADPQGGRRRARQRSRRIVDDPGAR